MINCSFKNKLLDYVLEHCQLDRFSFCWLKNTVTIVPFLPLPLFCTAPHMEQLATSVDTLTTLQQHNKQFSYLSNKRFLLGLTFFSVVSCPNCLIAHLHHISFVICFSLCCSFAYRKHGILVKHLNAYRPSFICIVSFSKALPKWFLSHCPLSLPASSKSSVSLFSSLCTTSWCP